eukprot:GSChrysophyteH2.ASY1.ANO1.492.1 assembled CDS
MDISVELHFWRRRMTIVKRFKFDLLTRENIKLFKNEATVIRALVHPNIVDFYGVLVDPPSLGIVMKYAKNGDLMQHLTSLTQKRRINANVFSSFRCVMQIADGMQYLHDNNINHRDLKSPNILLDDDFSALIADFGESRSGGSSSGKGRMEAPTGTPGWAAPECIRELGSTKSSDVFSFGIIFWELLTWRPPMEICDAARASILVCERGLRPPIPKDAPQWLHTLLSRCWYDDPQKRPKFDEIISILAATCEENMDITLPYDLS